MAKQARMPHHLALVVAQSVVVHELDSLPDRE